MSGLQVAERGPTLAADPATLLDSKKDVEESRVLNLTPTKPKGLFREFYNFYN